MVAAIIIAVVTTTIILIFLSSLGEFGVISDCFGKENLNEIQYMYYHECCQLMTFHPMHLGPYGKCLESAR